MRGRSVHGVWIIAVLAALAPGLADARTEEIRWRQDDPTNVAGFQIYWGMSTGMYTSTVTVGPHAPDPDGIHRYDISVPDDADVYVAMTSYNADDEHSVFSNERLRAAPALPDPDPPAAPDPDPDPPAPISLPHRINAGGPLLSLGSETWNGDEYFTGGVGQGTIVSGVSASEDAPVYETFRYEGPQVLGFGYEIPVADGTFRVVLHFAEGYTAAAQTGSRVFDIELEQVTVLQDLDVFASAGFATRLVHSFDVDVSDGSLSIFFEKVSDLGPLISGIEILDPSTAPAPPPVPPAPPTLLDPL